MNCTIVDGDSVANYYANYYDTCIFRTLSRVTVGEVDLKEIASGLSEEKFQNLIDDEEDVEEQEDETEDAKPEKSNISHLPISVVTIILLHQHKRTSL